MGKKTQIYSFSSIGNPPQDLKYKGEKNSLIIGNNNKFREYVNINPGTEQGGSITSIGDNNLFMVYCHVAHDCKISDSVVLANNVQVGGHVSIEQNSIVGGSCAIHQFSRIGESAMIGGMTGVLSDVIPFGLSMGNRNNLMGLNLIGLRRSKVSNESIKKIQLAYEIIFKTSSFRENIEKLNNDLKNNEFVKKIINFINSDKKRPISLPLSK
jgi:acyl-[acyl-carrier-protein]--UDP-N-acetylglucosamine O-acyltransferase